MRHLARDESDVHPKIGFEVDIDHNINDDHNVDDDNGRRLQVYDDGDEQAYPRGRTDELHPGDDGRGESLATRRRLALEVQRGLESARLEDPDIDAKDSDIRLMQVWPVQLRLQLD